MTVDPRLFTIDARGHKCPVPTLRLKKALSERGEEGFILLADDPMAQIDVPHFCNQNNYILRSSESIDEYKRFEIWRPHADAAKP
ncbi:sulfurtransferase TusA family protein [Asticcacaulis sp. BYS171W]|uniref:Sulfurtransferase TusA family protein n=1 Tax=Asticcacaulis aquaticus TaxID=2984212 RepID=A0ABT5HP85_9CAUL|nr:sulfurtransferase TusA family protein [Asticcacaulis aquaticus]